MPRNYCYRCFKTETLCVCDVETVDNRTAVWIVQHPAERTHPINSARLAALGLARAGIEVAWSAECARPASLPANSAVLFPSRESNDLEGLDTAPEALVLLDGTWSQARKLYRRNPWIQALPHVHLKPQVESRYRIRRQPKAGYLSTLEATVLALQILEPETEGFDALLRRFDAMIDVQERFIKDPPPGAYRHEKAERKHPPPASPASIEKLSDLVVCYGDFMATRTDSGRITEPVVIAMERVRTRERWVEIFAGVHGHPLTEHLHHMGVHPDEYRAAPPSSSAAERITRFLKETDTVCSWNSGTTRHLNRLLGGQWPQVSLKADYCNWTGRKVGHLEDEVEVLKRTDERVTTATQRLRAERRLHCSVEVLSFLDRDVRAVLRRYKPSHKWLDGGEMLAEPTRTPETN